MLTKAIIQSDMINNQYKIRIPKYHKLDGVANSTPLEQLPFAAVCYQPGILPNYQINDIVYVDFENDDLSYPVIFGKLLRDENTVQSSWCDIKTRSLNVEVDTVLSTETKIGNVYYNDLEASVKSVII